MVEKTQENTSFVVNETPRCNSFEVGKAGARHKIYYDTPEDLQTQLDKLKALGLYVEEA